MYWYIKYPLIAVIILAFAGITCKIVKHGSKNSQETPAQPTVEIATDEVSGLPNESTNELSAPDCSLDDSKSKLLSENDEQEIMQRLNQASAQMKQGNLEAARIFALKVLDDKRVVEFDDHWFMAADIVNAVNWKFMNSTAPSSEKQRYMVKSGDSMQRIAKQTQTCTEFLLRLNPKFKREKGDPIIHPGDALFYITTAWSIRVVKHRFILLLYREDKLYRYYNVGIGKENRTPVGTFVISGRQAHPAWTPPGKNIPYGDPENILGTHWLALTPVGDTDPATIGYGIHGTWDDDSIGTAASSGCIRMHNDEVNELYDAIPNPGGSCPPVFVTIEE